MSNWRDQILKEFTPQVSRLTLVADPDGLLLEEGILEGIRERGFELIPFEDPVAFRYAYESGFRSRWDCGEQTDLVVVLRSQASDLNSLPYDLLQAGRKRSFNLGDIFPTLSYPIITVLDRGDLDALYTAQRRHMPGQLGDNATKEFVLRHVFEIAVELIKQPSDLLRVLLRRHYRGQRIPTVLDDRFIQILRQTDSFAGWPLERIVPDREAFLSFLQERWPLFLNRGHVQDTQTGVKEYSGYNFQIPGPPNLPFDHHDVRVYMDTFFIEGLLRPVPHEQAGMIAKTWAGIGVRTDYAGDRMRRLEKLLISIRTAIPAEDVRYGDWFLFARGWAELISIAHEAPADIKTEQGIKEIQTHVDHAFTSWLTRRFAGLINLPPAPPVMLHHLPRYLARQVVDDKTFKAVLLVIDGLALDQWISLRKIIASQRPIIQFRESAVFAWIPTLTSISRQALFAGKPPIFFPNSILTTEKESALWSQFWADQGLTPNEIAYTKGLGDGNLSHLEELLSYPRIRVAGLVIDKVDRIMHGMELGTAGMHNQVRQWAEQFYLASLLDLLLDRGFRVFLTSDHGNIEAEGCGRPSEGAVADLRGERVRIYSDPLLRKKVADRFPDAVEWPSVGLPNDYLPLLAPSRKAFVREKERLVSHGGISIEEVIVPLVQIERKAV
ncbi:MAG: BREX-3 system phosphatase PglZ [Proteobacteria bacterium]|nr:BREX-3 system phosphatase PglZ [Pseudomonadota bacterium]MBU2261535.1 BREX-3 system phosphatase PglZ [Pseudomonadota bacterium]